MKAKARFRKLRAVALPATSPVDVIGTIIMITFPFSYMYLGTKNQNTNLRAVGFEPPSYGPQPTHAALRPCWLYALRLYYSTCLFYPSFFDIHISYTSAEHIIILTLLLDVCALHRMCACMRVWMHAILTLLLDVGMADV